MKFTELGLNEQVLEAISYMGFEDASPIQEQTIPQIINGKDVLAFAQTGTGKTAAFVLPILHKLALEPQEDINTVIIVPTRELAIQIDRQVQGFDYFIEADCACVYGGGDAKDFITQKNALKNGANIIVATPGKLISHLTLGYCKLDNVKHFILDEADRMLDMGFADDISKINSFLPAKKQTLFFSATMAPKIQSMANKLLNDPFKVSLAISKPAAGVTQGAFLVFDKQKDDLIDEILRGKEELKSVIVFCSKKFKVMELVRSLRRKGYNVNGISSDLKQDEREEVMSKFRAKKIRILVGTDVISRGIDIKDINMVINYDCPNDPEDYVHRIGRTARASTTGIAYTFINPEDMRRFQGIEKLIEKEVEKIALPEVLGKGPEWSTDGHRRNSGGGKGNGGGKWKSKKKWNGPKKP
ncbi:MAG: superfamily II DNA/RNA helicase [Glaciecola sp.]|jgi:superfamily II DNA/RNA helicase